MFTDEEKKMILGIIEDEINMVDFEYVYPENDKELIKRIYEKLKAESV